MMMTDKGYRAMLVGGGSLEACMANINPSWSFHFEERGKSQYCMYEDGKILTLIDETLIDWIRYH